MIVRNLANLPYHLAWREQEQAHADVLVGGDEQLLLVEHQPVITQGRRPLTEQHLLASPDQLQKLGVEYVHTDRGGDITFHGPGQLVAYPIIRLADHKLSVSGYVHLLEDVLIDVLGEFGLPAEKDPSAVGVWTRDGNALAKIAAIGVRIRRGVTLHGLALNVTTDLRYFDLIVPCGLAQRPVTSMQKLLGNATPPMQTVQESFARVLARGLTSPPAPLPQPAGSAENVSR